MSRNTAEDAYLRFRTGLTISLAVVLIQTVVLFFMAVGNFSDWSIGLFEDAMHGVADNLVLMGTTIVLYFEARGATPNQGRKRILALIGGVMLILSGVGGAWTAYLRISGAQMPISGWTLATTSLVAVIGGWFAFRVIHGVHEDRHDHLHKSATSHLIGDLAISVAVFLSSLGIIFFALPAIDSWMALILISPWLVHRGVQILRYRDPPASGTDLGKRDEIADKHDHHHH